jgi:hypothetical protein
MSKSVVTGSSDSGAPMTRENMILQDASRPRAIKAFLDLKGFPKQREQIPDGGNFWCSLGRLLGVRLDLLYHLDGTLLDFCGSEVVAEARPKSLSVETIVQINGQALSFRAARLDDDFHAGLTDRSHCDDKYFLTK